VCTSVLVVVSGGILSLDDLWVLCDLVLLGVEGVIVGKVFYV